MASTCEANDGHPRGAAIGGRLVATLLAAAALAGCGSVAVDELPPAATVAGAPARAAEPAGRVVPVGGRVTGLAFDAVSRQLAVAVAGPPRLLLLDPATGAQRRSVPLPGEAGRPVADGRGGVLVPVATRAGVIRVDARTGRVSLEATGAMRAEAGHLTADPEVAPGRLPAAVAVATTTPLLPPAAATGPEATGPTVAADATAPGGGGAAAGGTAPGGSGAAAGGTAPGGGGAAAGGTAPGGGGAAVGDGGATASGGGAAAEGGGDAVAVLAAAGAGLGLRRGNATVASVRTDLGASDLVTATGGRRLAVLAGRARTLEVFDATRGLTPLGRVDVGAGPARLASAADYVFVTDSTGNGLLVVRVRPRVDLERRLTLEGRPWAIALDPERRRLWVTLPATDEVVELPATRRPHVLRRFPALARPAAVAVDPASGRVYVAGEGGAAVQVLVP